MPLAQACLTSENPYQRKGGLMCLAVLAEGCADHIRTKYVQLSKKYVSISFQKNHLLLVEHIFFDMNALLADY